MSLPDWSDRFWSKVEQVGDCWEWTAARTNGYGVFRLAGRNFSAHRLAYELMVAEIPDGLQIDHLCRNRACVNPAHMEPVTNRENTLRGLAPAVNRARELNGDTCSRGHRYADPGVTYVTSRGYRVCRRCKALRRSKAWEAVA